MPPVVDPHERLSLFSEHWSPKIVACLNDDDVKVVELEGHVVWHSHPDSSTSSRRASSTGRRPFGDVRAMLIEPQGTVNTGAAGGPLTSELEDWTEP